MIYKMMKREKVSSFNEDSLLKGTHIAYFSVDTHMQMQPNHSHIHTPKLHIRGVVHTFSLKSYNGAHIFVWGADLWIVDQNHMKIYKTFSTRRESLPCDYWRKVCGWERQK